jgi:hypothetical protein
LKAQSVPIDVVLDAQSRQAQAEIDYFRALSEYNLAIAEVHMRKGSIMDYNGIALAEGPWPSKAYFDSQRKARERDSSYYLDYGVSRPNVVSRGPVKNFISTGPKTNTSLAGNPIVVNETNVSESVVSDILSHLSNPSSSSAGKKETQSVPVSITEGENGYSYGSLGLFE